MNLKKKFGKRNISRAALLTASLLITALLAAGCAGRVEAPVTRGPASANEKSAAKEESSIEESKIEKITAEDVKANSKSEALETAFEEASDKNSSKVQSPKEKSEDKAGSNANTEDKADAKADKEDIKNSAADSGSKGGKNAAASTEDEDAVKPEGGKSSQKPNKAAKAPEIENNGGYFVRCGDYVYFRIYGPDALPDTALFAGFMQPVPGSMSSIWRLNLKTNQYEKLFNDGGYGGLWFFQDALWLNRSTEYGDIVYNVDLETYEKHDITWGRIACISSDASHLVYEGTLDNGTQAFFVTGEEEMDQVVYATEGEHLVCCGAVGRDLYFISRNYSADEERDELWQMQSPVGNGDGKLICLGVFPKEEGSSSEFVQFLPAKDRVYVSVEYRQGTGHFYAGSHYVSAIPGKEDSMELLDEEADAVRGRLFEKLQKETGNSGETYEEESMKMYLDGSGKLGFSYHAAGEVGLRYNDGAFDLVLYESPEALSSEDAQTVFENWLPEFEYASEDDISCNEQVMEYVGGKVFTMYTESTRAPEEDIGWRYAYRLVRTNYEYFDSSDASGTDTKGLRHIDSVDAARRLAPEEVQDLAKRLNPDYYGFFLSDYHDPTEIKWREVCYGGAGIDKGLTGKQKQAYLDLLGETEFYSDITAIDETDLRNFVKKTTGTPYDDAKYPLKEDWDIVPGTNIYVFQHGDTNYQSVQFESGWDLGNDAYRLHYTVAAPDHDFGTWPYVVTFRIENGRWVFMSNLPE